MVKGTLKTEQKTISACLNDAKDELQSLGDEMDEWRSNMEGTNLEYTSKYETVSECADTLQDQFSSLEDVVSAIEDMAKFDLGKTVEVTYHESRRPSRRERCDMVVAYLNAAKDALQEQVDEMRERVRELEDLDEVTPEQDKEKEELEEVADEMEEQLNELDNIISELDGVEFPGMY